MHIRSPSEWLADMTHWRMERRIRTGYDPTRYEMPALKWAQSSFMQPQMMVHDRYFYDPVAQVYGRPISRRSRTRDTVGSMPCLFGRPIRIWVSTIAISWTWCDSMPGGVEGVQRWWKIFIVGA